MADPAAAQGARNEGARAVREEADGADALSRFWRRLAAEGASDLIRLYGECARLLEYHNAKRERFRHELDTELVNQAAANQRQHDDRIGALKREVGPEAPIYKERAAKSEDAQKALRAVRGEVNSRPLRTSFGPLYYLIMLMLALAEIPVNRAAFELTFREEPILSLLLAAAVGVILIFFAHVIGLILRRWPQRPKAGQIVARAITLVGIIGVVGGGVYVMARMRQVFLRLVSAENEGFAQRLQEALRGGTEQTVAVMTDSPFSISDWTFIAINVLILAFGIVASFLRHDPHPDYAKAIQDARRAERAYANIEKKFSTRMRDENARYGERNRSLENQMGELRSAIVALADQSIGILEHCFSSRQMMAQTIRKRSSTFTDGFMAGPANGRRSLVVPAIEDILTDLPPPESPDRGG